MAIDATNEYADEQARDNCADILALEQFQQSKINEAGSQREELDIGIREREPSKL